MNLHILSERNNIFSKHQNNSIFLIQSYYTVTPWYTGGLFQGPLAYNQIGAYLSPAISPAEHMSWKNQLSIYTDFAYLQYCIFNLHLVEKKATYKWTHTVQICAVQGSTVL